MEGNARPEEGRNGGAEIAIKEKKGPFSLLLPEEKHILKKRN